MILRVTLRESAVTAAPYEDDMAPWPPAVITVREGMPAGAE